MSKHAGLPTRQYQAITKRSLRTFVVCLLFLGFSSPGLVGCTRTNPPSKKAASLAETTTPGARTPKMIPQTFLRVQPDASLAINRMPGLKWAVVIQEGTKAYVGAFPQSYGGPKEGTAPRTGYRGPHMWDSPAELTKQNREQWIRALNEWYPEADTYDHRPRGRSGWLSSSDQSEIRQRVKRAVPQVNQVFITTDVASAALLHGYAEYISAGGDMTRYMTRFHQRLQMIWPHGTAPAPNRPSESPNFGSSGTPADHRTPIRGHI